MKRFFTTVMLAILIAMPYSARAGVLGFLKDVVKGVGATVAAATPQVSSPLLEQFGVSVQGINVDILNTTPFMGVLYVNGKKTATIKPGDVAHGKIHFEPLNPQVPIAVLFQDSLGRYLGAAGQIFTISVSSPASIQWTIQSGEIRTPDGSYIQSEIYPRPRVEFEKKNAFDRNWWGTREWWNATVGVQIVNNTFFRATFLINGEKSTELGPGELTFIYIRNYGVASGYTVTIQLIFTDQGLLAGNWTTTLYIPTDGVIMQQNIINPYDIRR